MGQETVRLKRKKVKEKPKRTKAKYGEEITQ